MGLLDLFSRREKEQEFEANKEAECTKEFPAYSGIRVEVTTLDERLLFVAKLMGIRENRAELHQYSEK